MPTQTACTLFDVARELLRAEPAGRSYRLIGAGLSDFSAAGEGERDFFAGQETRTLSGEKAVDALRARFGREAVQTGRALKSGARERD